MAGYILCPREWRSLRVFCYVAHVAKPKKTALPPYAVSVCCRSLGSDEHLPVVPGRGRSHVRHAGGVAIGVPGCRTTVGVR